MATVGNGNRVAVKVLSAILISVVLGFIAGGFGTSDLEARVRQNEKMLSAMQQDIVWIRAALENKGFKP
ncbi:MAG: hypothetical protein ABIH23_13645 [bacterium]